MRPAARQAWLDANALELGDPSRLHRPARRAGDLLASATSTLASILGVGDDEVVWTSGGTEAVQLAVAGTARAVHARDARRDRLVVSAVEHSSVLVAAERIAANEGMTVSAVGVDGAGVVDLDAIEEVVDDRTAVVHLQHSNHEVGALQPTHEVAEIAHRVGALMHVDACQSVGQLPVTLAAVGADLLTCSAAKFGGPPGVGALTLRSGTPMEPLIVGDDRQRGRRAGPIDVASVAAAAVALRVATDGLQREHQARELVRRHLRQRLSDRVDDVVVHGPLAEAHPGIVAVSALYVDGAALVAALDEAGFAVHSGSSCASAAGTPSHVLAAMGALTHGHVRIAFGPDWTPSDADLFVDSYAHIVRRLRDENPVAGG